jgi:hypothetical protein
MNYDAIHVLTPWPQHLWNPASATFNFALSGIGTRSPTIGTSFATGLPPQSGVASILTHDLSHVHGADCPTCNLQEIPFNPNLPHIHYME